MKKTKTRQIVFMSLSVLAGFLFSSEKGFPADNVTRLLIGSTSTTSSHYSYFVSAAKAINRLAPGIEASVVATGASVDNIERLRKGQIDLGLTGDNVVYEVSHGLGKWQGNPHPEFRWIWTYSLNLITLAVRKDSGIKSIRDLEGKPFHPGGRGSSCESIIEGSFRVLGIKPNFYRGSWEDAGMAMQDKRIVGTAKPAGGVGTPDALIMEIQANAPLSFLAFTKEDVEKIKEKYPYYLFMDLLPNVYKDQNSKVLCIGQTSGAITTSKIMTPEVGYKVFKAIFEGIDIQAAAFPAIKGWNICEKTIEGAPIPLHAGTVKYLKEKKYEVPPKLIPTDYKD